MRETGADLEGLQELLDRSWERAGSHLRSIITPERRMTARQLSEALDGMRLLVLATVTADRRPLVGPVDGVFYRSRFYFGSSPDSVRFGHIRRRPHVSASHVPGEQLAVTVHGTAVPVDVSSPEEAGFRQALLDVYVPRYGPDWGKWLDRGPVYARIEPQAMFSFYDPTLA